MKEYLRINGNRVYIDWNKTPKVQLTKKEYDDKLDQLREIGKEVSGYKTVLADFMSYKITWRHDRKYKDDYIYVKDENNNLIRYWWRVNGNEGKPGGCFAYNLLNKQFKEKNDLTLRTAFGCIDDKTQWDNWKKMQLPAPMYFNNRLAQINFEHVYKADISSAYPYQATKPLPDAHTAVHYDHYVKPTEEYPFAFYMNSHHIEIYNELKTNRIMMSDMYYKISQWKQENNTSTKHNFDSCEQEHTILMKASEHSLKDLMQRLYDNRNDDPLAKQISVSFFGMLQSIKEDCQRNFMPHVSAVIYARHWDYMSKIYNEIISKGNSVMQIQTDSFVWIGKPIDSAKQEKCLGGLHSEYENCRFRQNSLGNYVFEKDGKFFGFKHQGKAVPEQFELSKLEDIDNVIDTEYHYNKQTYKTERR